MAGRGGGRGCGGASVLSVSFFRTVAASSTPVRGAIHKVGDKARRMRWVRAALTLQTSRGSFLNRKAHENPAILRGNPYALRLVS